MANIRQEKSGLGGYLKGVKSELKKITNQTEKDFVINVAQDMKIDSVGKRDFLAEWMGLDVNMLFHNEEE